MLEAEEGRRNEPMLTAFLPDSEAPLDEDEERPPSTESSSSKFLSGGEAADSEHMTQVDQHKEKVSAEQPSDAKRTGGL